MFFWLGITLGIVAVLGLGITMWKLFDVSSTESYVENQLVLKFLVDTPYDKIDEIHKKMKCTMIEENKELGVQVVQSKRKIHRVIKSYSRLKEIDYGRTQLYL